jgi:hypothetical protein
MAWANSRERNDAADMRACDLSPTCPRCHELSAAGAKWCESCGVWLLDRGPSAPELAERQQKRRRAEREALLAGYPNAAPVREDVSPRKGTEE